ncbi:MAG: hypothetical protein ACOCXX_01985 [Planctomycetota bacterium]
MDLAKLIRATHPHYDALKESWDFYLASYEGGGSYITSRNLFNHVREDPGDYADRLRRAYYLNYCRAVVDTWTSHLFRKPASRRTDSDDLAAFLGHVDTAGSPIERFIAERVAPMTMVFGTTWILVDMPRPEQAPASLAEQREAGLSPYAVFLHPQDVTNWAVDAEGELTWVRIREPHHPSTDPFAPADRPDFLWRTWTRDYWTLHDPRGRLVDGGPEAGHHGLGVVPIVRCTFERSRRYPGMGLSTLNDIALVNREVFNLSSLLQEFLARQCFNFLVLDEDLLSDEGRRKLGTSNALPGRPGAVLPQYVSPPVDPAAFLQSEREQAIREIYRLALLPTVQATGRSQPASGIARAYDFHDASGVLASRAARLEQVERQLAHLAAAWLGIEATVEIDYPRDFSATDLADELTRAIKALDLDISPTFNREMKKRLHRRLLPGSPSAAIIDKEIDTGTAPTGDGPRPLDGTTPENETA